MKTKLLILIVLLISLSSQSQNEHIDSLVSVLKETKIETHKLTLLNTISNAHKTSSGTEVISYANKAVALAKKLNSNTALGNAYVNLGNGNIIIGNHDKAIDYFKKAKSIFEIEFKKQPTQDLKKSIARTYGSIGIVFSQQSNYSRAFQYLIKSITIYEELKDFKMLSILNNNVGVAYQAQEDYSKALEYYNKAKQTQKQLQDPNIGITLTNIANCHLKLKALPKALSVFNEAEQSVKDNPRALGEWHNSIGSYYHKVNAPEKAMKHWEKAIITFSSIDDKFGITDTYIFKSGLLLEQKQYTKAIENSKKALILANQTNVLEQQTLSEKVLSEAYEKQNNFVEALKHQKQYSIFKDSLVNIKSVKKSVQAQMSFEYEKEKNTQRLEQEKQQLLEAEEAKIKTIKYGFAAFSVLLLSGLGFLYYNRKQLKTRLTLEKELAEYEQKALHLQMNPHFIFNCLGAISGFIINNGTDHAIKYLSKFSKLMRLTLEYSKESLIPIGKEIESLQNYLELEKLRFNNTFNFTITKSETIEDAVAIPPLLIQPIVENAIIHGIIPKKAEGNLTINFTANNDMIVCEIIDDGVGIDNSIKKKEQSVQIHKSMALDIIKKRLGMITEVSNKKASIKSFQLYDANGNSEGTKVIITLPIQYID
ncbi:tetratricopeptide repeat-containing sensor histidine kinase [Lacinutrix algicola]|uniref:tetratricopeptide repeat-containing sensor histidine kinase n=1 Tax=Lacinutrix algicola TaxID=342954 RepID=UPI0006E13F3A|nr:tetratricopeptide repeat protein [Lacinutrix algicola]